MRHAHVFALVLVTSLGMTLGLGAGAASAAAPRSACDGPRRAPGERCKDLTIEGDEVDGTRVSPHVDHVIGRKATAWGSLIRVRTSLADKIVRSAEGVR